MTKIVITGVLPASARYSLESLGLSISLYGAQDLVDPAEFSKALKESDFYISGGDEKLTAEVLETAETLKFIGFLGVDCNQYIDVLAAATRGIKVCNTPGANAASVAEFALGLMLDAQRRITASAFACWQEQSYHTTTNMMKRKRVGLIGMGPIGLHIAETCIRGFHNEVNYWSRSGEKQKAKELGANFLPLNELIAASDILSIQIPGNASYLLNQDLLEKLNPGATIVSISPAITFDANALLNAMERDPLLYAAFDCFYDRKDEQQNPSIKKLRQLGPNRILITPHIAWRTFDSDKACYDMIIKSIGEFLSGLPPSNEFSP